MSSGLAPSDPRGRPPTPALREQVRGLIAAELGRMQAAQVAAAAATPAPSLDMALPAAVAAAVLTAASAGASAGVGGRPRGSDGASPDDTAAPRA